MANKIISLFDWWLEGLCLLYPSFIRNKLTPDLNQVVINIDNNDVVANHLKNGALRADGVHTFRTDNEIDKTSLIQFVNNQKKNNASIILTIPEKIILKKSLTLPNTVKSNLRQVLKFEISRKTPFAEDQVYFDYLAVSEDEKLNIDLYVVPIDRLEPFLKEAEALNIIYDAVSFEEKGEVNENINFVAGEVNKNGKHGLNKLTTLLATTTILLFLALLYLPLYIQQQNLELLDTEVKKKRKEAIQLQTLEKEKNTIFEQSHFLAKKREEQISGIQLINEVTHIVPDDTWLNRLTIKSGMIQLQGESTNASSLLQKIESSELFSNAQFRSPITKNNLTKKDRFNLSAEVKKDSSS